MNLVIKDALWQIVGRVASAIGGFLVIKLITPYLGPLRFGDYSTILKFFAIWSAFADFGIYVIALKQLGKIKNGAQAPDSYKSAEQQELATPEEPGSDMGTPTDTEQVITRPYDATVLGSTYGKFVSTRYFMIAVVYTLALVVAYLIPAYTANPYLVRGLPLGMLFSASFMGAGILQLPLQLFWQMKQLTVGLILARVSQLVVIGMTLFILFTQVDFTSSEPASIQAFARILGSVVISGVTQASYVRWQGQRHLPLRRTRDRSFTKNILRTNRQYGLAYYLSSFHTLIVLILLSIFYPTAQGYTLVGVWALALGLIEILLIVPSALGNSLIHNVAGTTSETMKKKFGSLLMLIVWIGLLIIVLFSIFAPHIISFVGGPAFLHTSTQWGSDTLLPYLAVILLLSFIKQVFNYVFVSNDLQNKLLRINLLGVLLGVGIGIPLIMQYGLIGGLLTQALLEILFVAGALWIAWRHHVFPTLKRPLLCIFAFGASGLIRGGTAYLQKISYEADLLWISCAFVLTVLITGISYPHLKKILKGL